MSTGLPPQADTGLDPEREPGVDTRPAQVNAASWLTLIAMTASLSMVMLDQTVVSTALPTMTRELPLSGSGAHWVVNAYVLAMATAVAIGGRLGSRIGPVTTFRAGVTAFFLASALCGFAPSGRYGETWLITARIGQGLGAALMMPVTASIVVAAFPARLRGRAVGAYVGISQIFLALGPLLGGTFTQWLTWRAVFWINIPVGLAALVLVAKARPANPAQPRLRINPVSTGLLISGLALTVFALQESATWGWHSPTTLGLLAAGLAITAAFVRTQRNARDPLVDVQLFTQREFLGDNLVLFATQFGLIALTLYASVYAQSLLGFSPIQAGFASLALILPLATASQLSGPWYDRSSARAPLLTGLAVTTLGAIFWTLALPDINYVSKIPGMALVGFGLGLVFSPVNTDALSRVTQSARPQASGVIQTSRQLGGTLGLAVISAVILARQNTPTHHGDLLEHTAHAIAAGFWIATAVFAAGLVTAWLLLRSSSTRPLVPTPSAGAQ